MTCPNKHPLIMSADTCPFCEASRLLEINRILREGLEDISNVSEDGCYCKFDKDGFVLECCVICMAEATLAKAKSAESGGG